MTAPSRVLLRSIVMVLAVSKSFASSPSPQAFVPGAWYEPAPTHEGDAGRAFLARSASGPALVTPTQMQVEVSPGRIVTLRLVGANPAATMTPEETLPGVTHDLTAPAPAQHRRNIPHHARVRVARSWPGIDVVHRASGAALEHDFELAPGADPRRVRMEVRGARSIALTADGSARIRTADGELVLHAPVAWNVIDGERRPVACRFVQRGPRKLGFEVGARERDAPLVIDPLIAWSTYVGGDRADQVYAIGSDASGNVHLVTAALSSSVLGSGSYSPGLLAKLTSDGSVLLSLTLLPDMPRDGRVLSDGAVLMVMDPSHAPGDVPNPLPGMAPLAAGSFAYRIGILAPDGTWRFLTQITQPENTLGCVFYCPRVEMAPDGDIHGLMATNCPDLPTVNAVQPTLSPPEPGVYQWEDVYAFAIDTSAASFEWATYFGGIGREMVDNDGVHVDDDGTTWILASTTTSDLPVTQPGQAYNLGAPDADRTRADMVLARFSPIGDLVFARYLGGTGAERPYALMRSDNGDLIVAGRTDSLDLPVTPGCRPHGGGSEDGYVARLSASGAVLAATYLGGGGEDMIIDALEDGDGSIWVAGQTSSSDFPTVGSFKSPPTAASDGFATRLDASMQQVLFSTFVGGDVLVPGVPGSPTEVVLDIALADSDDLLLAGWTTTADFPVIGALQPVLGGSLDGFAMRIDMLPGIAGVREPSALDRNPNVTPLRVDRGTGPAQLVVGWEETNGEGYALYMGDLVLMYQTRSYSHLPVLPCFIDVAGATFEAPPGNWYFLATALSETGEESSYGRDSFGRERPASSDPCP